MAQSPFFFNFFWTNVIPKFEKSILNKKNNYLTRRKRRVNINRVVFNSLYLWFLPLKNELKIFILNCKHRGEFRNLGVKQCEVCLPPSCLSCSRAVPTSRWSYQVRPTSEREASFQQKFTFPVMVVILSSGSPNDVCLSLTVPMFKSRFCRNARPLVSKSCAKGLIRMIGSVYIGLRSDVRRMHLTHARACACA